MIMKNSIFKSSVCVIILGFLWNCCTVFASAPLPKTPAPPKDVQTSPIEIKNNAKVLYNTNNKKEALALLVKLPRAEQNEETNLIIANIYTEMGKYINARTYLNKILFINPKSHVAYYNLGIVYTKMKNPEEAIASYKKAISNKRDFAYSYYNLGCIYLEQKQYKKAKSNFIRAIYHKNDEKDFYYNLAYSYKMLGDEKNAKKMLETFDKLNGGE